MADFEIRKLALLDVHVLEQIFPVMVQLRAHLTRETLRTHLQAMAQEKYELWGYFEGPLLRGLVSSRVYTDLVRGPHLYIDDLVTDIGVRSMGVGALLLKHMEAYADELGLASLRLCCAKENTGGMKFYQREGWTDRSSALVKKINRAGA